VTASRVLSAAVKPPRSSATATEREREREREAVLRLLGGHRASPRPLDRLVECHHLDRDNLDRAGTL
jgi:hypothetical protein